MDTDALQLRELVPVDSLVVEPGWQWWVWAIIAVTSALIVTTIVAIIRDKSGLAAARRPVDHSAAYQRALEEIEASSSLPAHEAATRISGAIRLYLATVCGDPSLFETHQEFLGRHEALQHFPENIREQVSTVLCQLAAMKYDQPRSETLPNIGQQSREVIEQLHQRIPA
ncbi:hypothetical protein [Haloferula rosea]|uniref:Uncharacterized protein n=1 Tax=Haloferula rosea TaxID=490093 RepID=A0A934VEI3_9BACT|nr:hypothetical protein [Haloferula rosea]MBK1826066.1 hypothetical protein [Haloferula rosea]